MGRERQVDGALQLGFIRQKSNASANVGEEAAKQTSVEAARGEREPSSAQECETELASFFD
jgi:hypothetical protein